MIDFSYQSLIEISSILRQNIPFGVVSKTGINKFLSIYTNCTPDQKMLWFCTMKNVKITPKMIFLSFIKVIKKQYKIII